MKSQRTVAIIIASIAALTFATGCSWPAKTNKTLTLATTTSTQDSGLLDVLIPKFGEMTGIHVKVVAVGSGQALELGRRGDADVLLTHAPAAEQKFMDEGWGENRRSVMHNDFVLVGPTSDPAAIKGRTSAAEALTRVADRKALFVSRSDESGTHQKEMEIWKLAGQEPHGDWYIQAGAGMAQVLRTAQEKQAYTLADRGTFLAMGRELDLEILCQGDPHLRNEYTVMITSTKKQPHVNAAAAHQFADFLVEPSTQKLVAEFGVEKFGEPLFFPTKRSQPSKSAVPISGWQDFSAKVRNVPPGQAQIAEPHRHDYH